MHYPDVAYVHVPLKPKSIFLLVGAAVIGLFCPTIGWFSFVTSGILAAVAIGIWETLRFYMRETGAPGARGEEAKYYMNHAAGGESYNNALRLLLFSIWCMLTALQGLFMVCGIHVVKYRVGGDALATISAICVLALQASFLYVSDRTLDGIRTGKFNRPGFIEM